MISPDNASSGSPADNSPKRFIFTPADLEQFRVSPTRRDLLSFATAMGKSCTLAGPDDVTYDPSRPLDGLSPAMASLHGSLRAMGELWLIEIPPAHTRARFGNPAFRKWHERIVERSEAIVNSILECHHRIGWSDDTAVTDADLTIASEFGYHAAAATTCTNPDGTQAVIPDRGNHDHVDKRIKEDREAILQELKAYLYASFGHPIRIDYGTGHESSFLVFLFALFHLGCVIPSRPHSSLRPVALSIFTQYLKVTRGIQTDYMLEPAGTHGVWGLDDYHCLPFYFGACQLINNPRGLTPECIHDHLILEELHEVYMYLGCIRYIKLLKKGVPFFESSPMLNDISSLPSWSKVATGLLRLYEGEVLDKLPVVQHFVFGNIFKGESELWTTR